MQVFLSYNAFWACDWSDRLLEAPNRGSARYFPTSEMNRQELTSMYVTPYFHFSLLVMSRSHQFVMQMQHCSTFYASLEVPSQVLAHACPPVCTLTPRIGGPCQSLAVYKHVHPIWSDPVSTCRMCLAQRMRSSRQRPLLVYLPEH